jgi:hypothetical protein
MGGDARDGFRPDSADRSQILGAGEAGVADGALAAALRWATMARAVTSPMRGRAVSSHQGAVLGLIRVRTSVARAAT